MSVTYTAKNTLTSLIAGCAVAAAAIGFATTGGSATPAEPAIAQIAIPAPGLAQWANANGLFGLSPASLQAAQEPNTLAEWAQANGFSGLSPASVGTVSIND